MEFTYIIAVVLLSVVAAQEVFECPSGSVKLESGDAEVCKIHSDGTTETKLNELLDHSGPAFLACPNFKPETVIIKLNSKATVTAIGFKSMLATKYVIKTDKGSYGEIVPTNPPVPEWEVVSIAKRAKRVKEITITPTYDRSLELGMKKMVICIKK